VDEAQEVQLHLLELQQQLERRHRGVRAWVLGICHGADNAVEGLTASTAGVSIYRARQIREHRENLAVAAEVSFADGYQRRTSNTPPKKIQLQTNIHRSLINFSQYYCSHLGS